MNAFMRTKHEAALIAEDDLLGNDDAAASYTWFDIHADAGSRPVAEDSDFIDIDIAQVPTLYDVVEQPLVLSQDDNRQDEKYDEQHDDEQDDVVFLEPGDDVLDLQPRAVESDEGVAPEVLEQVEEAGPDHHTDQLVTLADHQGDASQAPLHSMEELFNLSRYEPVQLQRALMGLAGVFQLIAAAALWRAIGDRVIVTELVPPLVYASIGVAAYLLGMRYVRIHFAQARVGDKDWLLCEQVMVAADNGVMLKARFGTAYLIWEQLLGVAQDSDYYYLLIEPSQGFKVPKQGVSDPILQIKFDDMASLTKARALQGT